MTSAHPSRQPGGAIVSAPLRSPYHSPDGLAEVHLRRSRLDHHAEMTGHQERWLMHAGPPGDRWYATASSFTPEGLVAAMNTALTDPAPVIRHGYDVRHLPPQATTTPVKPPVPTPLDVRRAQAASARSTVSPPAGTRPVIPAPRQPSAPQVSRPGHSRSPPSPSRASGAIRVRCHCP
ncbi:DUF317 domain-containing protein [Streptomyces sp. NPDC059396]|uniref:DUF317 domain-containing protein n=1 Tax=Streptomyces sp. NPDC059396 TaxID=3346819 RepID=UPI003699EE53